MVLAANSSAPAPAPMPDDTEDVVEAYSFNTGMSLYLPILGHALVMYSPLWNASTCYASSSDWSTQESSEINVLGAGLMVLLMVVWSAVGHQVASR